MAGVRISFSVVGATAKTEAAYNSASAQPWVDYNTLRDGLGLPGNDDPSFPLRRWATGEPNLFKLSDYRLFPSDGAPGYWSRRYVRGGRDFLGRPGAYGHHGKCP